MGDETSSAAQGGGGSFEGIGTSSRDELLWCMDGRANPPMVRKVVGVVLFGMVAVVTSPKTAGCSQHSNFSYEWGYPTLTSTHVKSTKTSHSLARAKIDSSDRGGRATQRYAEDNVKRVPCTFCR